MQRTQIPFSIKIVGILFILFCCGAGTSVAVEAPGSPFIINAGADQTLRTYTGVVIAGQRTLVAYERDIANSAPCYSQATLVGDFILTTSPSLGTVDFTGAELTGIGFQTWEDVSCGPVPWGTPDNARAIYYTAAADATGTDTFEIQIQTADIITVNVTIVQPDELGGVAMISPVLLQSSVKQMTSMISSRVKRLITPQTIFRNRHNESAPSAQVNPSQDDQLALVLNPLNRDKLDRPKRDLIDIVEFSMDSQTIGLSAGDASMRHGIWTNIAYTSSEDDNLITESDMDINSYIIGYDYKLNDRMAIGVSVTYEAIDADLNFNSGSLDGDGYTVAPYFTMLLTDYLAMDVIAGYAIVDYDQDRNFGTVTSSVDADRQFAQFALNGFHYIDQWSLNINLSFLYAHEGQDSYTESDGTKIKSNNIDFSQLSLGTEMAYSFKYAEPYITLAYERDTQYTKISGTSYDKSGGDGGIGCRMFFNDQLSGDIYGSTKFGRDDYDEYSILGNLRYDF